MNGMVLVDCQRDRIRNHLGDKTPGIPMRDYLIGQPLALPVSEYLDEVTYVGGLL